MVPQFPNDEFYLRSVTLASTRVKARNVGSPSSDVGQYGISVEQGSSIVGLSINIGVGAALLQGRLDLLDAKPNTKIHLLPSEESEKDNVLRYSETTVSRDGTFAFRNVAPGRYYLLSSTEQAGLRGSDPVSWHDTRLEVVPKSQNYGCTG